MNIVEQIKCKTPTFPECKPFFAVFLSNLTDLNSNFEKWTAMYNQFNRNSSVIPKQLSLAHAPLSNCVMFHPSKFLTKFYFYYLNRWRGVNFHEIWKLPIMAINWRMNTAFLVVLLFSHVYLTVSQSNWFSYLN